MLTISLSDIAGSLGLEKAELEKTLSSLVDSKIIKTDGDGYTINTEYVNKKRLFRLPTSTVKDHTEKEVIVIGDLPLNICRIIMTHLAFLDNMSCFCNATFSYRYIICCNNYEISTTFFVPLAFKQNCFML